MLVVSSVCLRDFIQHGCLMQIICPLCNKIDKSAKRRKEYEPQKRTTEKHSIYDFQHMYNNINRMEAVLC